MLQSERVLMDLDPFDIRFVNWIDRVIKVGTFYAKILPELVKKILSGIHLISSVSEITPPCIL